MTLTESLSQNVECYTPGEALDFMRAVFGGPPDLDPCADPRRRVGAKVSYTKEDDGLAQPWGAETVFINPPYGRDLPAWVEHGRKEMRRASNQVQLWLVPARTDTAWMHLLIGGDIWDDAHTYILDVRGRYRFLNENYGPFIDAKTGKESSPKFPNRWVLRAVSDHNGHKREDDVIRGFVKIGSSIGKVFRPA